MTLPEFNLFSDNGYINVNIPIISGCDFNLCNGSQSATLYYLWRVCGKIMVDT